MTTKRSPAWVQNVDQPNVWAFEHKWLLEAVFALFDRDGEWPRVENVQRALASSDPERAVAVAQLAIDIPRELGAREVDRLALTVRALTHCDSAAPLLEGFVAVIGQALAAYPGDEEHPAALSGFAVKETLGLDDLTYRKVSTLVFREPWFFNGGSGYPTDNWSRPITVEVLLAKDIANVADYLDVIARYRFGPPEIQVASQSVSERGPLRVSRAWLDRREATIRDLILVAIIAGVIVGVLLLVLHG
jgi:hypothetical protein